MVQHEDDEQTSSSSRRERTDSTAADLAEAEMSIVELQSEIADLKVRIDQIVPFYLHRCRCCLNPTLHAIHFKFQLQSSSRSEDAYERKLLIMVVCRSNCPSRSGS